MTVLINPALQKHIDLFASHLPQSVLLAGEYGVGLFAIATVIADNAPSLVLHPRSTKGEIDTERGTITIEKIRELYDQTRSKHNKRYIVIIDDAEKMSAGAQAAFLKLLEEPGSNVHFLLTSHMPQRLLSTVRSRVQHVVVPPITKEQTEQFIARLGVADSVKRAQLRFIAEGLPAELVRLVNDEGYFKKRAAIMSDARQLLQADTYERLILVNRYQSDRSAALQLIASMVLIVRRSLSQKPQADLVEQLEKLLDIATNLDSNYSVRLQLARCIV